MPDYPRSPIGLRWHDHYTMADQIYAAYARGGVAPARTMAEPLPTPEAEKPAPRAHRRTYASSYIGVTTWRKSHFVALWMEAGKDMRGPIRERTDRGERWAAIDRARALGLEYLEKRDGTRVDYARWEPEEIGVSTTVS